MSKLFKKKNKLGLIWRSLPFSVAIWFFCGLVLFGVIRETFVRLTTLREVEKFQNEITRLEARNEEMNQLLLELNTSSNLQKEARAKLGLQKEGEGVIIFPSETPEIKLKRDDSILITGQKEISNAQKWYIFFKTKLYRIK